MSTSRFNDFTCCWCARATFIKEAAESNMALDYETAIEKSWVCFVASVRINRAFYPKVRLIYL